MPFSPDALFEQLQRFPATSRYWVAYSGGCDSHVLLHALVSLRPRLGNVEIRAVHINHGLSAEADRWAEHCREVCTALDVAYEDIAVDALPQAGESPEAAARRARYHVFAGVVQAGEGLLLAHHQDDQAETLLLQLFRGAGVKGLAAMGAQVAFAEGWLGRPLLNFSRQSLLRYAKEQELEWIDDPSNFDVDFDRNFLRQRVLPLVTERWPALSASLARSASHQAEAAMLLHQLAEIDWQECKSVTPNCLSVSCLRALTAERRNNLLRHWISQVRGLPVPGARYLARINTEVLKAAMDANPLVDWPDAAIRRYRDDLYALSPLPEWDPAQVLGWGLRCDLALPDGHVLRCGRAENGRGLKASLLEQENVSVRFRRGGEVCRPVGRGEQRHSLKKLMQEWGVPPWQRDRTPLIYVGDELAQVVGFCVCAPFQAPADEEGLWVTELKPDAVSD